MIVDQIDRTLAIWRASRFMWGHADCLLSIGDYIAARDGLWNVADGFRGTYDSEAGAQRWLRLYGGVSGIIGLCGLQPIEPADAIRGDVVVLDTGDASVGALCTGPGVAARLERGVVEVNRRLVPITHAWTFE
jgi:hypothetical protein